MDRCEVTPNTILLGDSFDWLKKFPDNTFTAVVTDPPYGLSEQPDMREVLQHWLAGDDYEHRGSGFMGKDWDSFVPGPKIWEQVYRVLKPGGHILSFSGTRTFDLMTTAMRLASFEVRDKFDVYFSEEMSWMYGSGFPKSMNIGKAIDAAAGVDREVVGYDEDYARRNPNGKFGLGVSGDSNEVVRSSEKPVTAPATDEAKQWEGHGTALKPAHEPIAEFCKAEDDGRRPEACRGEEPPFKYTAKASRKERNYGCKRLYWLKDQQISRKEYEALKAENDANKGNPDFERHPISRGNVWPTVKPLDLVRYLIRLVKMPGDNLILDPFCGSGTTACACILEGCDYVTIDKDPQAVKIAEERTYYFRCLGEAGLR